MTWTYRNSADKRRAEKQRKFRKADRKKRSQKWQRVHRRAALEDPHSRVSTSEILGVQDERE